MTTIINVILNLIQNQLDPDFRQDDGYSAGGRIRQNLYFLGINNDPELSQYAGAS